MTTKEVAKICGVTDECIRQNAKKVGIIMEHGKSYDWTEEELKKVQLILMKNQVTQGVPTIGGTVEVNSQIDLGLGAIAKAAMNDLDAAKQFAELVVSRAKAIQEHKLLEEQNKLLLEQKEHAEANYQAEKMEHQKDKELILHKYLTATQIKETILKEYGKKIVVSKAVKRIPLDDNDILYKPFKNGDFTGQQPVYHPNVLDKIREILG